MDVLDVDEMPVLVVSLVRFQSVRRLVRDIAFFPSRHCGLNLLEIRSGLERCVDPARLPAPGSHECRCIGPETVEVLAKHGVDLEMRIFRYVLHDAGDLVIDGLAARDGAQCLADYLIGTEPFDGFRLGQYGRVGRAYGRSGDERELEDRKQIIIGNDIIFRQRRLSVPHDHRA